MEIKFLIITLVFVIFVSVPTLLYIDYLEFEQEKEDVLPLIFEYCNDTSGFKNAIGYHYSNETHFINNEICKWQPHQYYPNSTIICNPYVDKLISGEEIRNKTHIFNKDSCSWDDDPDYDPLNTKGCPQFCPKEEPSNRINEN